MATRRSPHPTCGSCVRPSAAGAAGAAGGAGWPVSSSPQTATVPASCVVFPPAVIHKAFSSWSLCAGEGESAFRSLHGWLKGNLKTATHSAGDRGCSLRSAGLSELLARSAIEQKQTTTLPDYWLVGDEAARLTRHSFALQDEDKWDGLLFSAKGFMCENTYIRVELSPRPVPGAT